MKDQTTSPTTRNVARAKEILQTRARALAHPVNRPKADGEILEVIEFRLAGERYGIEQASVREVYPLRDLTPLPCVPAYVLGIVNVRGQILPVINIKTFFELPDSGITDLHVILIARVNDIEVGILADVIIGVRSIPVTAIQPSLPTLTGIRAEYLRGVTDDHIAILDVSRILADPKITVNEEVEL